MRFVIEQNFIIFPSFDGLVLRLELVKRQQGLVFPVARRQHDGAVQEIVDRREQLFAFVRFVCNFVKLLKNQINSHVKQFLRNEFLLFLEAERFSPSRFE